MEIFLPIAHMDVNVGLILLFGAAVGFLSGLVGVGGGWLITPLLIFIGVPPVVAVSTGAAQMAGTSAGACYAHWRLGHIDFKMGAVLLTGSLAGGGVGVYLVKILHQIGQFGNVVTFLYVILLSFIGASMLVESVKALKEAGGQPRSRPSGPSSRLARFAERLPWQTEFPASGLRLSAFIPSFLGFAVGVLTSLMGVGGGFIMVPVMIYLLKMPTKTVVGTSLFQLLFTTAIVSVMQAGVNHAVDPFLALILILGSVVGTQIGVRLSTRLRGEQLRLALALVVIAVAAKMLADLLAVPPELYHMAVLAS